MSEPTPSRNGCTHTCSSPSCVSSRRTIATVRTNIGLTADQNRKWSASVCDHR
ncbi:hypothetical protein ACVDFE_40540 [Lentzea chajnantorensis]